MRLTKQENLRLLRSCTHAKIIELTEKLANIKQRQMYILAKNPDLTTFVKGIYIKEMQEKGEPYEENPSIETLANTYYDSIPEYIDAIANTEKPQFFDNNSRDVDENFVKNLRTFSYRNSLDRKYTAAREEYRAFADKLYSSPKKPINIEEVKNFLDTKHKNHTESFARFARGVKFHTPMHLGLAYRKLLDNVASRNNIADHEYSTKAGKVFDFKRADLSLKRDFEGRFKRHGVRIAALAALSTIIIGAHAIFGLHKPDGPIQEPTSATVSVLPETDSQIETPPIIEVSAEKEDEQIFRNSIKHPETYEEACKDYFEKISDIYTFNTGKEINLSGYGQSQIGYNSSARILIVEKDGQTYTFSGQGDSAPNFRYLKESLEATGAKVQESSSSLYYIADKNDSSKSLAIADSQGNSVRSGKVLTGSNNAYNAVYVEAGRKILEEQGIKNPTQAQCVGAYLLSDAHAGDPELAKAISEVQTLTRYIKGTFYYRDGKSDSYTVQIYAQKSANLASDFEAKHANDEKAKPKAELVPRGYDEQKRNETNKDYEEPSL